MAFAGDDKSRAHFVLGGVPLRVDQNSPLEIQTSAATHRTRNLFRPGTNVDGRIGAQNVREEVLLWHQTDWSGGEGQVGLDGSDDQAFRKFFKSEGLDFSVPGQVTLNKSVLSIPPTVSAGSSSDIEGTNWLNEVGTGTVVNTTDFRVNLVNDIGETTSFTPGAAQVQATAYAYKEAVSTTTVEGSTFTKNSGPGTVTGDDWVISATGNKTSVFTSTGLVAGTDITAGETYEVTSVLTDNGAASYIHAYLTILKNGSVFAVGNDVDVLAGEDPEVSFTPAGTNTYKIQLTVIYTTSADPNIVFEEVAYGLATENTSVTFSVWNETDGNATGLPSTTKSLSNTSSAAVATLQWTGTAAKAYRVRMKYNSGNQRPIADKVAWSTSSTSAHYLDAIELGMGGNVHLVGHPASGDNYTWTYNFSTETWTEEIALDAITEADSLSTALAHSATYEYILSEGGEISRSTTAADEAYTAAIDGAVGIAICQDRLFVLQEDATNGIDVITYGVDVTAPATFIQTTAVTSALLSPDLTLRQRITGSPTGARFFVNLSPVTSVIYEADGSSGNLTFSELARLPVGWNATSIVHFQGQTFIGADTLAETGETSQAALWILDSNGSLNLITYLRRTDPNGNRIQFMQPYLQDLWMLQGKNVWRYDLDSGGLFLEYELAPGTEANAAGLAVVRGHVIAIYTSQDATNIAGEALVAGSVDTYRQTGGFVESSVYDFNMPGISKLLHHIQLVTDDLPADTAVQVEYQIDQDGTWVDAGTHSSGSESTLTVSPVGTAVTFRTLQTRTTLISEDGDDTPTLKAAIVTAYSADFEEFFDLTVHIEDETSSYRVPQAQRKGGAIAADLFAMRRANAPVTLVDGYTSPVVGENPEYTVLIENIQASFDDVNEGRLTLRLRVVA